jgi:transposase
MRQRTAWDVETTATVASLRTLARRIQVLNAEIAEHTRAITVLVRAWRPDLLTRTGVGPIVAGIVLCAWSHPGRSQLPPSPCLVARRRSLPPAAGRYGCGSTAPGTAT